MYGFVAFIGLLMAATLLVIGATFGFYAFGGWTGAAAVSAVILVFFWRLTRENDEDTGPLKRSELNAINRALADIDD